MTYFNFLIKKIAISTEKKKVQRYNSQLGNFKSSPGKLQQWASGKGLVLESVETQVSVAFKGSLDMPCPQRPGQFQFSNFQVSTIISYCTAPFKFTYYRTTAKAVLMLS